MLLEEIRVHEHFILIIVTKKITVFNNIMVLLKMFKKYTHTHWKFFCQKSKDLNKQILVGWFTTCYGAEGVGPKAQTGA